MLAGPEPKSVVNRTLDVSSMFGIDPDHPPRAFNEQIIVLLYLRQKWVQDSQ